MSKIRKSVAGNRSVMLPNHEGSQRGILHRPPGPNWGWLAWLATALTATGLLAWRILELMRL